VPADADDPDVRLVAAIRAGDERAVAGALADGADANGAYDHPGVYGVGRAPVLFLACREGRLRIAEILLDRGADPNGCLDEQGGAGWRRVPCVFEALPHPDLFKLLLARGADPNATREWGEDGLNVTRLADAAAAHPASLEILRKRLAGR
jgi:hypothetical protein